MANRVTIFPEWGGYKIKVDNSTVGAAPAGNIQRAKDLAKMQAKNINETVYDILDKDKNVIDTVNI